MKNLNIYSILTCMLAFGLNNTVVAQGSASEASPINTAIPSAGKSSIDPVVTQRIIDEAIKTVTKRDKFRNEEDVLQMEKKSIDAQINKFKSEKSLMTIKFLVENVPAEILVAGEKETIAFVRANFIDTKLPITESKEFVRTLWKSSDNTLTEATPINRVVKTKFSEVNMQSQPSPTTVTETEPSSNESMNIDQDALAALNISKEDLELMFGGEAPDISVDNRSQNQLGEQSPDVGVNVVINEISVSRAVLMGKNSFINASLVMKVISNNGTATVKKEFTQISPGYMFKVNDITFELLSIDENSVIFENVNTKVTYRELID